MAEDDYVSVPEWDLDLTKYILITQEHDFKAYIQWVRHPTGEEQCLAHLEVFDFQPSTLRRMLAAWIKYRPTIPETIFCLFTTQTKATHRFAQKLGFQPMFDMPCTDGKTRTLYVHRR